MSTSTAILALVVQWNFTLFHHTARYWDYSTSFAINIRKQGPLPILSWRTRLFSKVAVAIVSYWPRNWNLWIVHKNSIGLSRWQIDSRISFKKIFEQSSCNFTRHQVQTSQITVPDSSRIAAVATLVANLPALHKYFPQIKSNSFLDQLFGRQIRHCFFYFTPNFFLWGFQRGFPCCNFFPEGRAE